MKTNSPRASAASPDGLLLVDKAGGMSSHDVVSRVRRLAGTRKVGHAGTLDPMATGVLVLGLNRATKLLTYLVGSGKTYEATIRLGQATVTDDAEGESLSVAGSSFGQLGAGDVAEIETATEGSARLVVEGAVAALTGDIMQVPSSVSAIKVNGQRSYAKVRAGEDVALAARPVTVSRFEVLALREVTVDAVVFVDVDVVVDCSSGTYIRALARDLGAALGCGGHLTALRRTAVGRFDLSASHTLTSLGCPRSIAERDGLETWPELLLQPHELPFISLASAVQAIFATRTVTEAEAKAISYGQLLTATPLRETESEITAALTEAGDVVALLQNALVGKRLVAKPMLNFSAAN